MEYNSAEILLQDIRNLQILPVYILHGDEPFFIDKVSHFMEETLLEPHEKDFNLAVLYGRDVDFKQVMDNTRQFPMMSQRRVVILKEAHQMKDLDRLLPYIEHPAPHTVFVIAHSRKKIDGRSKWLKIAKKSKTSGVLLSEKIKEYKLGQWLNEFLKNKKRKITPQANHLLCEYLGNDLKKLVNEIEKLELNIPENGTIGTEEVERYIGISKEFNVFELLSALGARDAAKAYFITDNLAANLQRNPIQMMGPAFFQYFQKVYITKKSGHLPDHQLASVLRVNPFFIREYKKVSNALSARKLESILENIAEMDARIKGVGNRKTSHAELLQEIVGRILLN